VTSTTRDRVFERDGAPAIPGLSARFFGDASDWAPLAELFGAANMLDVIPWLPTAQQVQLEFEAEEGTTPVDDIVLVEVDGRLIAATGVERVMRDGVPTYELWGSVDPEYRRRGIGTWLTGWALERARVRASREDPLVPVNFGAFSEDTETGHRAILATNGFVPVRHFFLMARDLSEPIPDAPLPDDLDIRPVTPDQWRTIFDAENEAFRDHWGHREATDRGFEATFARDELDTSLWVVAWAGDEVAGVVQNWIFPEENERLGVERGWLEHISVRRPWRRRGVGRAITALSLERLRERGLAQGMLGVDSENPTGALGLYEGLGFTVASQAAAYRRPLDRTSRGS
jgi:mycothiol synthase